MRNAVAEAFITFETEELRKLPNRLSYCIMELALDETELTTRVKKVRCQTVPMVTWHARLFWVREDAEGTFDIVLPPAMLESTRAECLLAVVLNRLPLSIAACRDRCDRFVLVFNTDSGTSCIKLANNLQTQFPCIPAPCRMHQ